MKKQLILAIVLTSMVFGAALKPERFRVTCPECNTKMVASPTSMSTNGSFSTTNGVMVERLLQFTCSQTNCGAKFSAHNKKLVKTVTVEAVEE